MSFTVAIVGRPNVGKSTLFNRLVGARRALVDPTPGVTRDRIAGEARLGHLRFTAIDTAGLDEGPPGSLEERLREQTAAAIAEADVALMLIDAKSGLTALDRHFARWLRRSEKPVILVANKCEGLAAESLASEAWGLGLGAPIAISAQHGEGLADLAEALAAYAPPEPSEAPAEEVEDGTLRLTIVGRPNVGKSSLINRLLEDERLLTGPEPGLTRDAVAVGWEWRGRRIELIDTAGLRRRARIEPGALEELSSKSALAALRQADVVVLMVDASAPLEQQDVTIANRAAEAGRALVVAANKWDLVEEPEAALALLRERLESRLPHLKGIACLPISVRTGKNLDRLLQLVFEAYDRWSKRIGTGPLNRWLAEATAAHPPPMAKGRRVKIRYATQVGTRPPTFVLFVSQAGALPETYLRYLTNSLREAFDLPGVPIRLRLRTGKNPYV
ncbi:MAG TPA: ribosome biogenesis GTPase Der [Geminicoccaceae bacterium]|nr:ribosome biogenesis GTPase Der [Geminicoccaceae bacterium]